MTKNLFAEDVMSLDIEFMKLDSQYDFITEYYNTKLKEIDYNYIYTESIDSYNDVYTEAEEEKSEKQDGIIKRMFEAIRKFIINIRAKLAKLFGNEEKANKLLASIDGNSNIKGPDYGKAIDEINETSKFFNKAVNDAINGKPVSSDTVSEAEQKVSHLKATLAALGIGGGTVTAGLIAWNNKDKISGWINSLKQANSAGSSDEQLAQQGQSAQDKPDATDEEKNNKKSLLTYFNEFIKTKFPALGNMLNGINSNVNDSSNSQSGDSTEQPAAEDKDKKKDNKDGESGSDSTSGDSTEQQAATNNSSTEQQAATNNSSTEQQAATNNSSTEQQAAEDKDKKKDNKDGESGSDSTSGDSTEQQADEDNSKPKTLSDEMKKKANSIGRKFTNLSARMLRFINNTKIVKKKEKGKKIKDRSYFIPSDEDVNEAKLLHEEIKNEKELGKRKEKVESMRDKIEEVIKKRNSEQVKMESNSWNTWKKLLNDITDEIAEYNKFENDISDFRFESYNYIMNDLDVYFESDDEYDDYYDDSSVTYESYSSESSSLYDDIMDILDQF